MRYVHTLFMTLLAGTAWADPGQERQAIVEGYARQARQEMPAFAGFSAQRGESLFRSRHAGGKPDTPTCTTCHQDPPTTPGATRANKPIDPMAISKNPGRITDLAKVEKWFGRNCESVLGRPCTALEKGDVIAYLNQL